MVRRSRKRNSARGGIIQKLNNIKKLIDVVIKDAKAKDGRIKSPPRGRTRRRRVRQVSVGESKRDGRRPRSRSKGECKDHISLSPSNAIYTSPIKEGANVARYGRFIVGDGGTPSRSKTPSIDSD